ncbi:MAG TPA: IgGFc-binding protein [Kofleriaceae bacterium]|nr:IgGFc-binding protein [Kofleriaceae bacterium]
MRLVFAVTLLMACGPSVRDSDGDGGNGGDALPMGTQCSSDLHEVLDDAGNVVGTCPPDQGCAAGACVPACQAAAASQGSVGCDFVVATPSFYSSISPPCFAVFLANNWPSDATVTITRGTQTFDATMFGRVPNGSNDAATWPTIAATGIASSNVGVLFLSHDPAAANATIPMTCPVPPAVSGTGGSAVWTGGDSATGIGTAFHITTIVPVSAYDIMPYGAATSFLPSAELLLPTSAWGTNYVTGGPAPTSGAGWGQLVAAADNTTVMISPTRALPAGSGVAAAPASTTTTYTLQAGQYIQWQATGEMGGSVIQSDKPVSFTGGTTYLCQSTTTSSGGGCDSGHQLVPPVSALGYQYVIPPHATRRANLQPESIVYRLVGAADGTTLTYSSAVTGAPATLNRGQVLQFQATGAFTITSQDDMHPFYVGQYMAGCMVSGGSRPGSVADQITGTQCLGDEEYVNILPPAQWLSSYVFFTDPTYTTTNLVVTRKAQGGSFQDVTVDCLGVISGWQPVPGSSEYQITNVDLQRVTPVGTCTNGRHTATSGGAFSIMVWGLATFASYAYPAGGNVGKINPVVVILRPQ